MNDSTKHRITMFIAASGAVLAVVATALGGVTMGLGAVVGAAVSVANWLSLRWFLRKVMSATDMTRNLLMLLLVAKMGALIAVCVILIVYAGVDAIGFVIGLTSLFVGIMLGAIGTQTNGASPAEEG